MNTSSYIVIIACVFCLNSSDEKNNENCCVRHIMLFFLLTENQKVGHVQTKNNKIYL